MARQQKIKAQFIKLTADHWHKPSFTERMAILLGKTIKVRATFNVDRKTGAFQPTITIVASTDPVPHG